LYNKTEEKLKFNTFVLVIFWLIEVTITCYNLNLNVHCNFTYSILYSKNVRFRALTKHNHICIYLSKHISIYI